MSELADVSGLKIWSQVFGVWVRVPLPPPSGRMILKMLKRYRAMIARIGLKDVKASNIDDAYETVCKECGCTSYEVLVMACVDPWHPGDAL